MPSTSFEDAAQLLSLQDESERLHKENHILREVMVQLTKENIALREDNQDILVQNAAYLQHISQLQSNRASDGHATAITRDNNATPHDDNNRSKEETKTLSDEEDSQLYSSSVHRTQIEELHDAVLELQNRVIILVQEKMNMHTLIESLEHQLVMGSHVGTSCVEKDDNSNPVISSSAAVTPSQQNKKEEAPVEPARFEDDECPLGDKPVAITKGSRRIFIGGLFSSRSRSSSSGGGQLEEEDLLSEEPELPDFDIRQELEQQLYSLTTTVRPRREQVPLSGGTHPLVVVPTECDRDLWDRMKNDQHLLYGMFGSMGDRKAVKVPESPFRQAPIDKKRNLAKEKRQSSTCRTGRFSILSSNMKAELLSSAQPAASINIDDKRGIQSLGGNRNMTNKSMLMDADIDLLEHFDCRREFSESPMAMGTKLVNKTRATSNAANNHISPWRATKKDFQLSEETRAKTTAFELLF